MLGRFWDMLGRFWAKYLCRRVEVKVKAKAKAKILFNEGVSKILGGGMPPKIFDTPSFGFGFDFDFDWDFDWDNPIFLTQVSALNAKNFWRV